MLRVDETPDAGVLQGIDAGIRHDAGVVSAGHPARNTPLIPVVSDPEATRAARLRHRFRDRGAACPGDRLRRGGSDRTTAFVRPRLARAPDPAGPVDRVRHDRSARRR